MNLKQILLVELKRAFLSPSFFIIFAIGTLISLLHIYHEVLPWVPIDLSFPTPPLTPFVKWIGLDAFSFASSLFYLLMPLISAIPFADSYLLDVKSGFIKNVYTKVAKVKYVLAKYIATFLSGALAFVLPLLVNLVIVSLMLPSIIPDPTTGTNPITNRNMWDELYYSAPYIYILSLALHK